MDAKTYSLFPGKNQSRDAMKKFTAILFLIFAICGLRAFGTELSETNNGFFLAIGGARNGTNDTIQYNEDLAFLVFYTLRKTNSLDFMDLQYPDVAEGVKLELIGPDGRKVPRTGVGKIVGSKWDTLHDRRDSKFWFDIYAGNDYDPRVGAGGGRFLYPADRFFKMKKPGIYTLTVQMQMFRYTPSTDPEEQFKNLIRFSPIKIKVEKPPDGK